MEHALVFRFMGKPWPDDWSDVNERQTSHLFVV